MDSATIFMQSVIDIHNLEGGKRFANAKGFDTVASEALYVQANCAFYSNQQDAALPLRMKLKDDPIEKKVSVYVRRIESEKRQNKDAQVLATIQEGRKAFHRSLLRMTTNLMLFHDPASVIFQEIDIQQYRKET